MEVISKFTVASEQGLENLLSLKQAKLKAMYHNIVPTDKLTPFIEQQVNYLDAISELNVFCNQLIIVYAKNEPAGFAMVKQTSLYPEALNGKRILHYSYFHILPEFDNAESRESLWQKCLSISRAEYAVWMEVLQTDPLITFLESCGFVIHQKSTLKPFDQPSYILIRYKDNPQ
ncbi:hypothetical protein [Pedobacter sp. B4-66]|uniref:hypothetical protein n=1 Tax=Pedobacter sp. B4-66 TaxID=2817280 RepID=UPI001BDAA03E|nr:hypothetical protein [Pedobacter sp. B4-66]